MRRWILACAGAAAALALAAPVADAEGALQVETKFGFNFAKFEGDVAPGAAKKTGFTGGVGVGVPLSPWFSIQPELWYVMKGTSYGTISDPMVDGTTHFGTYEVVFAVDYLELPVLARTRMGSGPVRPVLMAGPVVGWKVLEKFRLIGLDDSEIEAPNHAGRALDFGATAGFALEFGPYPACVVLEGRYTRSLTNIQKPQYEGTFRNTDVRVNLGWRIDWPSFSTH